MGTVVQSANRWNYILPFIPLCLLSLIFFAVSATLVLSLISVYLPTRNINSASAFSSGPLQTTFALPSGTNLATGSSLDSASQTSLQNQMQTALSASSNTNNMGTVKVDNAVGGNTGKKKRRQTTIIANVIIVTYEIIFNGRCITKPCRSRVIQSSNIIFSQLVLNSFNSGSSSSSSSSSVSPDDVVTGNLTLIQPYWANLRAYEDNPDNRFGVQDTGLPDGCQVEQAFVLHRHGIRYPSGGELAQDIIFATKVQAAAGSFTGILSFLNTWSLQLGSENLIAAGTNVEFASGVSFWVKYGRILYNAPPGQFAYNSTGLPKPLLRCNTIQRVNDSAHAWANGFFGIYNPTDKYSLLVIPAALGQNNTLASFLACTNFNIKSVGLYDTANALYVYLPYYLQPAATRISAFAPSTVNFTLRDIYSMQSLCTYEFYALGSSEFCSLFTLNEWKGFAYTLDLFTYNGYSFGNAAGRSMGVGYLQELIARLNNQFITTSNSSVNSTLDSSNVTFPLGQPFYLDMSHDFMIVGTLTAMSLDYFHQTLPLAVYPPPENRTFQTRFVIPYAARLITEKIGCTSSNPTATNSTRTFYTTTQYGYSAASATNKFIRMRLNSGILPLSTIRGGLCSGRTDGLCSVTNFINSQNNITAQTNYAGVCFGTYVFNASAFNGDGNYFP